ncbi:MAG: class I SAM-dependent methyltransferase [Gammaproteobacteria bacterium]
MSSPHSESTRHALALPAPDPDAQALSAALVDEIRRAIETDGGSIGFDRYMEMALYAPRLGYYHNGSRKFGADGDFVTAPELSPLFARAIARHCALALKELEGGDLLEFGPGSGALAAELLADLERLGALPGRYLMLELSGELRQRQHERLCASVPHLTERVEWLQVLPAQGFAGVVLANEVLDAMPVMCFAVRDGAVFERRVGYDSVGRLDFRERTADAPTRAQVDNITAALPGPLPDGYRSEFSPALDAWVGALGARLARGLVLICDYGYPRGEYYHPQRRDGTLLCHYRHRAHADPFFYPGLQDISANVDFTVVAEAAATAELDLLAYTSQAQFLLGSGLLETLELADNAAAYLRVAQEIKLLTLPGEMGDRFQVMALGKHYAPTMRFSLRDFRGRL